VAPSLNRPCPCGSGLKYKRCHGDAKLKAKLAERQKPARPGPPSPEVIAKVRKLFRTRDEQARKFTDTYGHIRRPVSLMFGGKRMIVVGGSIYKQTRDGPYTFMNAIHDCGLEFFGLAFLKAEEEKPFALRHPAIQWMHSFVAQSNQVSQSGRKLGSTNQSGSGAAWFRFCFDVFTIRDNARLENLLKERLQDQKTFQGARHELRVAALCLAAGFTLDFEDETDTSKSHPEFIATDTFSGTKVAVEAKSRHRRGVHGFTGGRDSEPGTKVDIRQLILDAYKKKTDLPFYALIDVNLPPTKENDWQRWLYELDSTVRDLEQEGYADDSPANLLVFLNDPSHYLPNASVNSPAANLWIKYYLAKLPRVPHPQIDMVKRILTAHQQRVAPPADFFEEAQP
jgi:hypothetical protein